MAIIRFMRIFTGVPLRCGVKDSAVIEKMDFQSFRTLYVFGTLGNEANIISQL